MEKDFQAFLTQLELESIELPSLKTFFRSLLVYYFLFPDSGNNLGSDKLSFISKELQANKPTSLAFILSSFSTTIDHSLFDYLKQTDWWWNYLGLLKYSKMTIYQLSIIHESTMSAEHKKSSGMYFTPEPQVKFICKYSLYNRLLISDELKLEKTVLLKIIFLQEVSISDKNELRFLCKILSNLKVIDPSCGSGLFLYEMNMLVGSLLQKLLSLNIINNREYQEYLYTFQSKLSGYDVNKYNTVITKFMLLSTFFHLQPDRSFELVQRFDILCSELNIHEENFLTAILDDSTFDLCIGNPPYLRHHDFDKNNIIKSIINSTKFKEVIDEHKLKFDAKADIYLYFWVKGMTLLSPDGVLSFVLSRSWYSSRFMTPINTMIAKEYFSIDLILELPSDPWSKAQIRTNIIFGHRKTNTETEQVTKILVWKKTLLSLLWNFDHYLHVFVKDPNGYISRHQNHQILSEESKDYRISQISNVKFIFSQNASIINPLIRLDYFTMAPFLLHDILLSNKTKFCMLNELGRLSLGSTTGANAYFYLDQKTIAKYSLSSKYLVPMTKSPKDAGTLTDFTFNKKLSLLYIAPQKKLENNLNLDQYLKKIKDEVLSRPYFKKKSKISWFRTTLIQPDLMIPNMTFLRSFVAYNQDKLHIDKQWIGFWSYDKNWLFPLLGFLNSSLGLLLREIQGTRTLGLGSLKLSLGESKNLLVLNPRLYPHSIINDLNAVVQDLLKEKIPVFGERTKYTEIQKQLDKIICLDYLGLEPSFLEEIQKALVFETEWRLGKLTV